MYLCNISVIKKIFNYEKILLHSIVGLLISEPDSVNTNDLC